MATIVTPSLLHRQQQEQNLRSRYLSSPLVYGFILTPYQVSLAYDFLIMNTLACAKLSALFLYRRLFNVAGRGIFNAVIMATVIVVAAWYITFDALSLLQCRSHFSAFWDGDFLKYCDLNPVWAKGLAISDFLLDLWVVLLPVPMVRAYKQNTCNLIRTDTFVSGLAPSNEHS